MKKVGILTFHNAINYGAILQAYALQTKIKQLGGNPSIIDYDNDYFKRWYSMSIFSKNTSIKKKLKIICKYIIRPVNIYKERKKTKNFLIFIKKNFNLSKRCDKNSIDEICQEFDGIIVGSDQVWNMMLSNYDTTYFLGNVSNPNKYSYAASLGKSSLTDLEKEEIKTNLPKFKKVLVRENEGKALIKECCGIDSTVVLDPTLLLDYNDWNCKIKEIKMEKYILIYLVQRQKNLLKEAEKYAKINNCKIVSISPIREKNYIFKNEASIEEFLGLIKNAECIFTTSFHGVVFSINFNKNFYFELAKNINNLNSRIVDICTSLDLMNREIKENDIEYNSIDYTMINKKLESLKEASINELKQIIENLD